LESTQTAIPEEDKKNDQSTNKSNPFDNISDPVDEEKEFRDEYREEDFIAKIAFLITVIGIAVLVVLFIYFIVKCQFRSGDKIPDPKAYSKKLDMEEDSIIDLSTVN
jgi:hypothetical protein